MAYYITNQTNSQTDPIPTTPPASTQAPQPQPSTEQHADPEEVDISQHYYKPETTNRVPPPQLGVNDPTNISEDQLRQMMLGLDRPQTPNGAGGIPNPFLNPSMMGMGGPDGPGADDPMMKMLSQMLGGAGAGGMPPFGGAGNNPFAQAGGPFGGMQQQQQQQHTAAVPDWYAAIWRLLHFILAMGLGLYIAVFTGFTGTKIDRERSAFASTTATEADDVMVLRKYFFWTFATAETILLSSRFFLDRGRAPPAGMLWTVLGLLPEGKWKGYLVTGLRYMQIFGTVRSDILTCVFVLGVCSWART